VAAESLVGREPVDILGTALSQRKLALLGQVMVDFEKLGA
jgi:hypothetical protein